MLKTMNTRSPSAVDPFQRLYEDAVDFGVHPNERSITGSAIIERKEKETLI